MSKVSTIEKFPMKQKILLGSGVAVSTLTALSVWNYRRITLKPRSLGSTAYDAEIQMLPVRTGGHTLYGEMLMPNGRPHKSFCF